jgi:4'-phosphopantetheinyl transferase
MAADSVELWLVDLDACGPALQALEEAAPRLSAEDRERASRVPQPQEAARRLTAYIALRIAIERMAGAGVRGGAFERSPAGKPRLDGTFVQFSLSHTEDLALIGVTRAQPIGVDLEKVRSVRMDHRHMDAIRAAGAGLGREPLPGLSAERAFLQAWARLEAFTKARGDTLPKTLAATGVRGRSHGKTTLAEIEARARRLAHGAGLFVSDVRLPPGLHGAVATARALPFARAVSFPADRPALDRILAAGAGPAVP